MAKIGGAPTKSSIQGTEKIPISGGYISLTVNQVKDYILQNFDPGEIDFTEIEERITINETHITQNAEEIELRATKTEVDTLTGRVQTTESTITQQATQIELKVAKTDYNGQQIMSLINVSPSTVKIQASKINLTGAVTFDMLSANFVNDLETNSELASKTYVQEHADGQMVYLQYSTNGSDWHNTFTTGDKYMRQKVGLSGDWTIAIPIVGTNGTNGKSAYQLAVEAGFVGTEVEWLASLNGQDGTGIAIKGSVADNAALDALPTEGLVPGDSYLVTSTGLLHIWDGTSWSAGFQFKGDKGNPGVSSYLHVAYSNSIDGTVNFSTDPFDGATFIGILVNTNPVDSTTPSDYAWTGFRGEPMISSTEPTDKYIGMVWIDTSKTPPEQKYWNGTAWMIVGMTSQQAADFVILQPLINEAKTGKTIIVGGYINTEFIDTNGLVVRDEDGLSIGTLIEGNKIRTGLLNASQIVVDGGGVNQSYIDDQLDVIDNDRNVNQPPSYYLTNYPKRITQEIKNASDIGLVLAVTTVVLQTQVNVSVATGGAGDVTQQVNMGSVYYRASLNGSNWSAWVQMENTTSSQVKANSARDQAVTTSTSILNSKITNKELGVSDRAYNDFITFSDFDNTIITGSYIKTELINVSALIVAGDLATMNDIPSDVSVDGAIPMSDNLLPNSSFMKVNTAGWSLSAGASIKDFESAETDPTKFVEPYLYFNGGSGIAVICTNKLTAQYPSKDKIHSIRFEIYPKKVMTDLNIGWDGTAKSNIKINGVANTLNNLSLNTWSVVTFNQKPTVNSAFVIKTVTSNVEFYIRTVSVVTGENPPILWKAAPEDIYLEVRDKTENITIISGGLVQTGVVEVGNATRKTAFLSGIIDDPLNPGDSIVIGAGESAVNRNTAPFRVSQAGEVWMTNAHVSGEIEATSGSIGTLLIDENGLTTSAGASISDTGVNFLQIFSSGMAFHDMGFRLGLENSIISNQHRDASTVLQLESSYYVISDSSMYYDSNIALRIPKGFIYMDNVKDSTGLASNHAKGRIRWKTEVGGSAKILYLDDSTF